MAWVEVFAVLVVSHLVGDYLLQTDWQARHKRGGLGPDPTSRRALLYHVISYTLAFVPAMIWLADDIGAGVIAVAAAIFFPHLIQDDGRLLNAYMVRAKKVGVRDNESVATAVDQSFHIVTLFAIALVAGS